MLRHTKKQNKNNSIFKLNDNASSRKFYLLKKTPKKSNYKNSMPNIKGQNIYKNINREINKFQYLSNKLNGNMNNNHKNHQYSHFLINDYKKISPQNKKYSEENSFNINNTNIINNKIIQNEGSINNNIIIINGEIVEQNDNKGNYPLISISKNNISLKRVSLKGTGMTDNKNRK